jgi:hypothetical protein
MQPGSAWLSYFEEAATPVISSISPIELGKTLLYPALKPLSLEEYVAATKTFGKREQRVSNGTTTKVIAFEVQSFDTGKLISHFPAGATIDTLTGTIEVSIKGQNDVPNRPLKAALNGTFTYQNKSYQFAEKWVISGWTQAVDTATNPGLKPLQEYEPDPLNEPSELSLVNFIGQLGISSLALLPNSVTVETDQGEQSAVAETPSGSVISTVGAAITSIPSAPTQPASDEAKKRDEQRKKDIASIAKANGAFPVSSLAQTVSSTTLFTALVPTYLTAMPVDPLASSYWYEYESSGTTYTLRSVLENADDGATGVKKGSIFTYYELTGN